MSYYLWGFIQTIMFLILNVELRLWVESAEQVYYLITMIIGVFVWNKNVGRNESIEAKKFNKKQLDEKNFHQHLQFSLGKRENT